MKTKNPTAKRMRITVVKRRYTIKHIIFAVAYCVKYENCIYCRRHCCQFVTTHYEAYYCWAYTIRHIFISLHRFITSKKWNHRGGNVMGKCVNCHTMNDCNCAALMVDMAYAQSLQF